jgi:hypothetical protein
VLIRLPLVQKTVVGYGHIGDGALTYFASFSLPRADFLLLSLCLIPSPQPFSSPHFAQATSTSMSSLVTGLLASKPSSSRSFTKQQVRSHFSLFFPSLAEPSPSLTAKRNGSISAEHGIGRMKASYVGYSKSETAIKFFQQTRRMFDPRGILMPGKYLPSESELPVEE